MQYSYNPETNKSTCLFCGYQADGRRMVEHECTNVLPPIVDTQKKPETIVMPPPPPKKTGFGKIMDNIVKPRKCCGQK